MLKHVSCQYFSISRVHIFIIHTLLEKPDREWVAVQLTLACLKRTADDQNSVGYREYEDQGEADEQEDEDQCQQSIDGVGDLKIEHFPPMLLKCRDVSLFQLPDEKWHDQVAKGENIHRKSAEMAEHELSVGSFFGGAG